MIRIARRRPGDIPWPPRRSLLQAGAAFFVAAPWLAACAPLTPASRAEAAPSALQDAPGSAPSLHVDELAFLNRVSWGANTPLAERFARLGPERYLEQQLRPPARIVLPADVQAGFDAMTISQQPLDQLVFGLEQRRKDADALPGEDERKAAQQAYQNELNRLAREAATRSLLLDLYSPNQLQEQMTWFWMNHFSLFLYKANLRAMLGDFEYRTLRPRALGRFRDLLTATVFHPAMLRYLDNEQNAAGHINENYARELMELHTMGVGSGYTQKDVQELARILTGLGVNRADPARTPLPKLRPDLQPQYRREGLFEFNPNRHDYGDKVFLGATVKGRGVGEVEEVLTHISRQPATARFISRKLAVHFVADNPPQPVVERMERIFQASDGDIAAVLDAMFRSPEFAQSLRSPLQSRKFKDPLQYVVSSVRLAYGDKAILNAGPMIGWLNRMSEPPYGRPTPDGYPLDAAAWSSPGQLSTRFEIARAIGSGSAGLFKPDAAGAVEQPAFPQLANALYYQSTQQRLGEATRAALDRATSPQEWNTFLLSSPEFMYR